MHTCFASSVQVEEERLTVLEICGIRFLKESLCLCPCHIVIVHLSSQSAGFLGSCDMIGCSVLWYDMNVTLSLSLRILPLLSLPPPWPDRLWKWTRKGLGNWMEVFCISQIQILSLVSVIFPSLWQIRGESDNAGKMLWGSDAFPTERRKYFIIFYFVSFSSTFTGWFTKRRLSSCLFSLLFRSISLEKA